MSAFFFVPAALMLKGRAVAVAPWAIWRRGIVPAAASLAAYAIVVCGVDRVDHLWRTDECGQGDCRLADHRGCSADADLAVFAVDDLLRRACTNQINGRYDKAEVRQASRIKVDPSGPTRKDRPRHCHR